MGPSVSHSTKHRQAATGVSCFFSPILLHAAACRMTYWKYRMYFQSTGISIQGVKLMLNLLNFLVCWMWS